MKKNIKGWLIFTIFYHFVPTALTFYYLTEHMNIVLAYVIACTTWGTILYLFK